LGLITGTRDNATDLYAIEELQKREDLDSAVVKKIQYDKRPAALYGI